VRVYVDSSVVLQSILNADPVLDGVSPSDSLGSSDLLVIECHRVLQRERMASHLDDQQYAESVSLLETVFERLHVIEMGSAVKRRAAGPFPTVIGTLDAIHLASALLWAETQPGAQVSILTRDRQLALCAKSLGLRVF
jgi:hypothetical protein